MAEIQNQLQPLVSKVEGHGRLLRSLYSNGSGGPPGYLEKAREEDLKVQTTFKDMLDKIDTRMDKVEDFILLNEHQDKERDKHFKRWMALWTLGVAIFMALFELWAHRGTILHSLADPPAVHSQLEQQSTVPAWRQ